jgi:hypothetical protein
VFSAEQRLEWARRRIRRGSVCRWWEAAFNKPKFAVILNVDCPPEPTVIFAFTTSDRPGFYKNNKYVQNDIVVIPAKKYGCFPLETVINLREVRPRDFTSMCTTRDFHIEEDLREDDLDLINTVLRNSELIAVDFLKLILP